MRVRSGATNPCATGIAPNNSVEGMALNVFPNPNSGMFTLSLESKMNEEVHVQVTNLLGQKVKEATTATNTPLTVQLDMAAGVYLLTGHTAHGTYTARVTVAK